VAEVGERFNPCADLVMECLHFYGNQAHSLRSFYCLKSLLSGSWWVSSSHPFPVYNLKSWNYVVRICYVVISSVLVLLLLLQSVLWALPILQMISGNVSCSLQLRIVQIVISNFRIGLRDAKVGGQNPRFLFFSSDHIGPIKCVHNQIWNG
jgi:hypothetical protein